MNHNSGLFIEEADDYSFITSSKVLLHDYSSYIDLPALLQSSSNKTAFKSKVQTIFELNDLAVDYIYSDDVLSEFSETNESFIQKFPFIV